MEDEEISYYDMVYEDIKDGESAMNIIQDRSWDPEITYDEYAPALKTILQIIREKNIDIENTGTANNIGNYLWTLLEDKLYVDDESMDIGTISRIKAFIEAGLDQNIIIGTSDNCVAEEELGDVVSLLSAAIYTGNYSVADYLLELPNIRIDQNIINMVNKRYETIDNLRKKIELLKNK